MTSPRMLVIPQSILKNASVCACARGAWRTTRYFPMTDRHGRALDQGSARRIHIVDLNGAFAGKPVNGEVIEAIARAYPEVPVQVAAGFATRRHRGLSRRRGALRDSRHQAVNVPHFVSDVCTEFPGHIIVGLDAKDGKVAIDGWSKLSGHDVVDWRKNTRTMASRRSSTPTSAADGMLSGVNIEATVRLADAITIPVIGRAASPISTISASCAVWRTTASPGHHRACDLRRHARLRAAQKLAMIKQITWSHR